MVPGMGGQGQSPPPPGRLAVTGRAMSTLRAIYGLRHRKQFDAELARRFALPPVQRRQFGP